jgi:diguanylate cyclase (GGDEF)-like protein
LAENRGTHHFDNIKNISLSIERLKSEIYREQHVDTKLLDEIDRLLLNATKLQSKFSVYLNSSIYFPKIVQLVRDSFQNNNDVKKIDALNTIERDVLLYTRFSSPGSLLIKEGIQEKIKLLRINSQENTDGKSGLVVILSKHLEIMLRNSEEIKVLNNALLDNKIYVLTNQLIANTNSSFNDELDSAETRKNWFYFFAFLLAYVVIRLWRQQQNMLREFGDNAKVLQLSMKTAKQAQFTIDIQNASVTLGKKYDDSIVPNSYEQKLSVDKWLSRIHSDDRDTVSATYYEIVETKGDMDLSYRWMSQSNKWLWVHNVGRIVEFDHNGKPLKVKGITTDVSAIKRDEHVLRVLAESNDESGLGDNVFQTIVKELAQSQGATYAMIAILEEPNSTTANTVAVWAGDDYAENFSYSLVGTPCEQVLDEGICIYPTGIQETFPQDTMLVDMGVTSYIGSPLKDRYNNTIGLIAILDEGKLEPTINMQSLMRSLASRAAIEIERQHVNDQLHQLAHYDSLTGQANRSLLEDRFLQATAHAKRTQTLIAVCFVDLDDFKPINDNHGHDVGDELLVDVSRRLAEAIRGDDTVARLGGDEFVLLLGEVTDVYEAQLSLDRVVHSIASPYEINGLVIKISASIGFTLSRGYEDDLDVLIRQADQAMYEAKSTGKNKTSLFDIELVEQASQKHSELEEIRYALGHEQMRLFYQPKVNMQTGDVYGVEALIRWQHPEKGLVAPFGFLPAIENTSLEIVVGDWVINQALFQLSEWNAAGLSLEVSVNISSYHLLADGFVQALASALANHKNISPAQLQIEVLESSVIADIEMVSDILKICRDKLGVSVALDDFGTGYSSLAHLRHLPAGVVKIDRSFVMDILDDQSDYEIVKGIVSLCEAFKLDVIAEGVETSEQGLALLEMGCSFGQGFGIAKPMPAEEVSGWLHNYSPNKAWLAYEKAS